MNKTIPALPLRLLALAVAVIIPACVTPPPPAPVVAYGRAFGRAYGELAPYSPVQERPGGMLVAGTSYFFGAGNHTDLLVTALKSDGSLDWSRAVGGPEEDYLNETVGLPDGGLLAVGGYGTGPGTTELWAVRLKPDGSILWQKSYPVGGHESAMAVCATADGGFVIGGLANSFTATTEPWILKIDGNGIPLWQYRYGGGSLWTLHAAAGGGFIASATFNNGRLWIFKVDDAGVPVWGKYFDEDAYNYGHSILTTVDGGCLVTGQGSAGTTAAGGVNYDFHVIKLDAAGGLVWQHKFGTPDQDEAHGAVELQNGDLLICGASFTGTLWEGVLLRLKSDGTIDSQKRYGGAGYNVFKSIRKAPAGGYWISGETSTYGSGSAIGTNDLWFIQTDTNGVLPIPAVAGNLTATTPTAVVSNQLPVATATTVTPVTTSATSVDAGASFGAAP